MECHVTLLVPIVPLIPMDERNPAVLKQNHTENSLSPLNDMQFTNGVPMECKVILLVPIVPLVPMDEQNPAVLKQNHTLMRSNSPMVYQWHAKSFYWYQSYHWYQWTNGIQLYSNRTIPKIAEVPLMICNSPMVYQWNAKSLYWYQSYHWYQWTSGIQLYSNRTIPKIA